MLVAKKTEQKYAQQRNQFYEQQLKKKKMIEHRATNSSQAGRKVFALGLVFVMALTAISLVNHFISIVRVNYEISVATRELQSLFEDQQHIKLEIASLRSPDRLERIAMEIGMQYPDQSQFIILAARTAGGEQ